MPPGVTKPSDEKYPGANRVDVGSPCGSCGADCGTTSPRTTRTPPIAAHRRLKRYFYGDFEKRPPLEHPEPLPQVELSEDARFAAAVQRALQQQGYRGDPYHVVMREFPEWTWGFLGRLESRFSVQME